MDIIDDNRIILPFKYSVFFLIVVLFITIPSEGAIEQRGQLISIAAETITFSMRKIARGFIIQQLQEHIMKLWSLLLPKTGLLTPETQSILQNHFRFNCFLGRNIRFLRTGCSVRASSVPEAVIFKGKRF